MIKTNVEEVKRAANLVTEAWGQLSKTIEELADSISKIFNTLTDKKNQTYKTPTNITSLLKRGLRKTMHVFVITLNGRFKNISPISDEIINRF